MGDIGVEVEDPQGKNTVELLMEDKGNQVYRCVYKPMHPGPHVIKVSFAGDTIPKSPFIVQVGEGECWGGRPCLLLALRLTVHTAGPQGQDNGQSLSLNSHLSPFCGKWLTLSSRYVYLPVNNAMN